MANVYDILDCDSYNDESQSSRTVINKMMLLTIMTIMLMNFVVMLTITILLLLLVIGMILSVTLLKLKTIALTTSFSISWLIFNLYHYNQKIFLVMTMMMMVILMMMILMVITKEIFQGYWILRILSK